MDSEIESEKASVSKRYLRSQKRIEYKDTSSFNRKEVISSSNDSSTFRLKNHKKIYERYNHKKNLNAKCEKRNLRKNNEDSQSNI